tara:strand:+ start:240 stop:407 length:168 start_codon:yes stop_codon:yes gene_type:complete
MDLVSNNKNACLKNGPGFKKTFKNGPGFKKNVLKMDLVSKKTFLKNGPGFKKKHF